MHRNNLETLLCDESLLVLNETQLIAGLLRYTILLCMPFCLCISSGTLFYLLDGQSLNVNDKD